VSIFQHGPAKQHSKAFGRKEPSRWFWQANLRELPRGDEPQVAEKADSETGLTEATYRCPKCGAIVNRWIKD
jgi:hypothetical protein